MTERDEVDGAGHPQASPPDPDPAASARPAAKREPRLLRFVVGGFLLLGLGAFLWGRRTPEPAARPTPQEPPPAAPTVPAPPPIDAAALGALVEGAEPFRWAWPAIDEVDRLRRAGAFPREHPPSTVAALADLLARGERGAAVHLDGVVVAVGHEARPPSIGGAGPVPRDEALSVLWHVVMEDADGGRAIVAMPALAADPAPRYERAFGLQRAVRVGDHARVAAVALQSRTGTFSNLVMSTPTPVAFGLRWRQSFPAAERALQIADPGEADWDEVKDRTFAETRVWEEDALFQVVAWARRVGATGLRDAIVGDNKPYWAKWSLWERDAFEIWKQEVPGTMAQRPFTDSARGRLFRLDVLLGDVLEQGWAQVPPNRHGVDDIVVWDALSDDYHHVALRLYLPFAKDGLPDVRGERREHLRVYGVFLKNWSYQRKQKTGFGGDLVELTTPTFIVLHAEYHPEGADLDDRSTMNWLAGAMVGLALLFFLTLGRRGRKEERRLESATQKRRRARMATRDERRGLSSPASGGAPPAPGVPPSEGEPRA